MAALKWLVTCSVMLLLSGCLIPGPQRAALYQESRSGFKKYYNLKYLKTPHTREDILMAFGRPHFINTERKEFIYLSSYYYRSQAALIGFTPIPPDPSGQAPGMMGGPTGHCLDVWYRLKFNQDWQLIGSRWYLIHREQFNIKVDLENRKNPDRNTKRTTVFFDFPKGYYQDYQQHFTDENLYWDRNAKWWDGEVW